MRTINFNSLQPSKHYIMPTTSPNLNQYDVENTNPCNCETWLTSKGKLLPKCAVIELSTKAVKLLVNLNPMATANNGFNFNDFFRKSERTETGQMLSFDNTLNVQSFSERVLPVIHHYKYLAKEEYHVDVIYTVATAAYRTAGNKKEILKLIKKETGLNVRILPKKEEATATLWAYIFSTKNKKKLQSFENHILLDQGGGSTEISIFHNKQIVFTHSFEIGTSLLKSWLFRKLSADLYDALCDVSELAIMKTKQELDSLPELPISLEKNFCIGVGKSITTATGKQNNPAQHETILNIEQMENKIESHRKKLYNHFSTVNELKSTLENKNHYQSDQWDKELMLCLGLPVIISILKNFHIKELTVNGTGLFYGIFFEKFFELN